MQVINNLVSLTSAECRLFQFMGLTAPQGKQAPLALRQMAADIKVFRPECAVDYANLRILEKLHNTLAVMVGAEPLEPRVLGAHS